jgi:hypothetical protein
MFKTVVLTFEDGGTVRVVNVTAIKHDVGLFAADTAQGIIGSRFVTRYRVEDQDGYEEPSIKGLINAQR